MNDWRKRPAHAVIDGTLLVSVAFTWHLPWALERVRESRFLGYPIRVGGPAVRLIPDYLPVDVADLGDDGDWLFKHNPAATRTSRGCPRRCSFCAVPRLHESMDEFQDFRPAPLVCDDNFLACSRRHIERAVGRLVGVRGVDFNQGLDARLFGRWHLEQLQRLDVAVVRFAWDSAGCEKHVQRAVDMVLKAGLNSRRIRVYVLLNAGETQGEARYRCEALKALGVWVNPMRYQPLDALEKNAHLDANWTEPELRRFVRYWSRMAWFRGIPYEEFRGASA